MTSTRSPLIVAACLAAASIAPLSAAAAAPPAREVAPPGLYGRWRIVSYTIDGVEQPLPSNDDSGRRAFVVFRREAGEYYVIDDDDLSIFRFQADDTQSPRHFDLERLYPIPMQSEKGKRKGIYKFEGEHLIRCVGKVGAERPTEFESKPGDGRTLSILERMDKPFQLK
jgi:uncharacterized protein (TIGR03067 family)